MGEGETQSSYGKVGKKPVGQVRQVAGGMWQLAVCIQVLILITIDFSALSAR